MSRFRRNDDLPLWRGPAVKKKPPFSNARSLITCELMRSGDAIETKLWVRMFLNQFRKFMYRTNCELINCLIN